MKIEEFPFGMIDDLSRSIYFDRYNGTYSQIKWGEMHDEMTSSISFKYSTNI